MSTTRPLHRLIPRPGTRATIGRTEYTVIGPGCATLDPKCKNGQSAVTVRRDGQTMTECVNASRLIIDSCCCHDDGEVLDQRDCPIHGEDAP